MGTTTKTIFSSFLLCSLLLHLYFSEGVVAQEVVAKSESEALGEPEKRETLEIIIGGGGSPAPSPEAPCPPPPPKLNRLDRARRALLNFKNLIDDPNCYTQNWNDQTDTCDFNGIRCATYPTDKQRAVAGVDLNGARVTGQNGCALPLSSLLGQSQIPELTFFHVNSNGFAGSVPSDVINFPYFFELDLSNNKVKGQFPLDAIKSNQLVFLDLRFNELTGPIPFQLFQKDLDVIFINNNHFTQYLPQNFGSTPARYLTFANNNLTGPIPKSVGYAPNLTEVLFLGNQFDGCLPIEIGNLKKAVVFDVSKNSLTGPIPLSFGCLKSIQYLNLANNKFYGCVPDNLCQIPSLRNNGNLSLANNYFNELGPSCWSLIKSKVLDVSKNCIHGLPNQRSPTECYYFYKTKKTCPNPSSFYTVPCKSHWGKPSSETNVPTSAPVTYKALKPHRLRL
ncbi:uncharacterized protein HKW66_Vig0040190 [Vigna angularis]|uniref:Cell wall hydroxyproline-rich glycoprotein n=1 Tax=Phaseolus angularis TaxID=3914 RepID=A0A8T0LAV2_PHAAN|nr:uncharacterized protein At4g06744 [Vigna angularis]KAG2409197.1 uncharacterized protein HKW66_Vig0040190 [Vigna angularis]